MRAQRHGIPRQAFRPVRRERLVDQVLAQLTGRLEANEFPVGARFPSEAELMAEFGVGRTTVREALRSLASAGVLEVRQGDGTFVRSLAIEQSRLRDRLTRARVPEVFEVRRALELEIAGLAAVRRSETDLAELRGLATRMQEALDDADSHAFADADVAFHLAMARATGNPLFTHLYESLATALRQAVAEILELPGRREACLERHFRALEAVERRDAATARAIRAEFLDKTAALLSGVFGSTYGTAASASASGSTGSRLDR